MQIGKKTCFLVFSVQICSLYETMQTDCIHTICICASNSAFEERIVKSANVDFNRHLNPRIYTILKTGCVLCRCKRNKKFETNKIKAMRNKRAMHGAHCSRDIVKKILHFAPGRCYKFDCILYLSFISFLALCKHRISEEPYR